ncbi:hypothetical protein FHR93_002777 [Geodermatophilus sabuli]|uniref:Zinc-binding dehydrogenase n=1 Tax=Geodermatophilus sabuli TaxID=1564158 RepID=A0A285EDM3_9ACTN|nr:hypothetical protein [Geodermatophilus sabuli]SNX97242.1 Zinc-binding dehydrogenase [Geodermatophilus sabuli]
MAEVGADVTDLTVGQRVGRLSGGQGSFADAAVVDAGKAVRVPDGLDDVTAAGALMQGVTAHYLATDAHPVQPGDTVLVHAAAGGVGQLLTQVVKIRGGRVIGTVSNEAKAEAARAAGAEHVLAYDDFAEERANSPTVPGSPLSSTASVRVMGALDGRGSGVAGEHVVRAPAGQHHQVPLLSAAGEPAVGEGVPEAMRVDVGGAGLRGAGVQHVAGAVGGHRAALTEQQ